MAHSGYSYFGMPSTDRYIPDCNRTAGGPAQVAVGVVILSNADRHPPPSFSHNTRLHVDASFFSSSSALPRPIAMLWSPSQPSPSPSNHHDQSLELSPAVSPVPHVFGANSVRVCAADDEHQHASDLRQLPTGSSLAAGFLPGDTAASPEGSGLCNPLQPPSEAPIAPNGSNSSNIPSNGLSFPPTGCSLQQGSKYRYRLLYRRSPN